MANEMTQSDWETLLRLVSREVRRLQRVDQTSTFVPEPGHLDVTKFRLKLMTELETKVRHQFEITTEVRDAEM